MITAGCHWTKSNQRVGVTLERSIQMALGWRGKCLQKLRTGGRHPPVRANSKCCRAGVQRPHAGLLVSSSQDPGLHPKRTRDPFSLARHYSINFRSLHQLLHYPQNAISKLHQPYSTLLRLCLPRSCILKILYAICK